MPQLATDLQKAVKPLLLDMPVLAGYSLRV